MLNHMSNQDNLKFLRKKPPIITYQNLYSHGFAYFRAPRFFYFYRLSRTKCWIELGQCKARPFNFHRVCLFQYFNTPIHQCTNTPVHMSLWSPQEHMQLVCGKGALAPMNKFACKLSWYIVYFTLIFAIPPPPAAPHISHYNPFFKYFFSFLGVPNGKWVHPGRLTFPKFPHFELP